MIFNGSLPGHEKVFNVRRCSMYTGVQFGRSHCTLAITLGISCNLYHVKGYLRFKYGKV